jgi:chorismate lyase/3-hydroxybenzoate synthase
MTTLNFQTPASDASYPTAGLMPPHWVGEWAGDVLSSDVEEEDRRLQVRQGGRGTLLTVRCVDAAHASPEKLEAETISAYRTIRRALEQSPHCHPVRLWNHLPQIHQRMDEGRDRYMVFNGGRFREYCHWWGGPQEFPEHLPTASGLGHHGADLVIHCLAMEAPGIAVENPRQVPAFGYSKRYGPLPPCFAR